MSSSHAGNSVSRRSKASLWGSPIDRPNFLQMEDGSPNFEEYIPKLKLFASINTDILGIRDLNTMTKKTLVKLISQLEILEIDELQKLSQAIQIRLSTVEESDKLAGFYNSLLASGLVSHIKPSYSQQKPRLSLIATLDGPISQTIIEDRR